MLDYSIFKDFLHGPQQYLPAKSGSKMQRGWLPVWAHLLDTAGIMEFLLSEWAADSLGDRKNLSDQDWEKTCIFIALVHDIGKFTPLFQKKIINQMPELVEKVQRFDLEISSQSDFFEPGKTPHGIAGEAILHHMGCPAGIASVVGSHHGCPQEVGTDISDLMEMYEENFYGFDGEKSLEGEKWETMWCEWLNLSLAGCGYTSLEDLPLLEIPDQMLASGLLIMADWIASNPNFFPLLELEENFDCMSYPRRIESAWKKISLPSQWTPSTYCIGSMDFRERFGFEWNTVQQAMIQAVEESCQPGIFILEAQMGVGKTEAALAGAELLASKFDKNGIFFGLPTQATANGIFLRLKQWAQRQSESAQHGIMLAHGLATLNKDFQSIFHGRAIQDEDESSEGLIVHPWFEGRKQALLSNFVIGTVDQLLMAALKQKHVMLRHLGLAGKVVIIDECHAYDAYMNRYLDRALSWLGYYEVPVILLSATLPAHRRIQLVQSYQNSSTKQDKYYDLKENNVYPLLTWTEGGAVHQQNIAVDQPSYPIRIQKIARDQVFSMVGDIVSKEGCIGIIMNTVYQAQQLTQELKQSFPDYQVVLIHSRFLMSERAEREAELLRLLGKSSTLEQRKGLIVVGTQILEQSLDIDFDFLITQICPMDLLLQRIGRLHRHHRPRPEGLENAVCAVLDVHSPDDGTKAIYGEWLLYRTAQILPEVINLPEDISRLVQEAYRDGEEVLSDRDSTWHLWSEHKQRIERKERRAMAFRIPDPTSLDQTLHGLLDSIIEDSESTAQASVRDGDPSIEILIMEQRSSGEVSFLSWQQDYTIIPRDHAPSQDECRRILCQRLRLPTALTKGKTENIISDLEFKQESIVPEWKFAPLLSGELFLFLDEQGTAILDKTKLRYTKELGLQYERKEI